MVKDFRKEIYLIKLSDKIDDKLIIMLLYNELCNAINSIEDSNLKEKYISLMEKTFELTIARINLKSNIRLNKTQYMNLYLKALKTQEISNSDQIKKSILKFKNQTLDNIVNMKYVEMIDKFDLLPLELKFSITLQFKEYINHVISILNTKFDKINSSKIKYDLTFELTNKLNEYIINYLSNKDNSLSNLDKEIKNVMSDITKNYLVEKLKHKEFEFENIKDKKLNKIYKLLNEKEKNLILTNTIYEVFVCDTCDKIKKEEKIKEICDVLDISRLEYTKTSISIVINYINSEKSLDTKKAKIY